MYIAWLTGLIHHCPKPKDSHTPGPQTQGHSHPWAPNPCRDISTSGPPNPGTFTPLTNEHGLEPRLYYPMLSPPHTNLFGEVKGTEVSRSLVLAGTLQGHWLPQMQILGMRIIFYITVSSQFVICGSCIPIISLLALVLSSVELVALSSG